MNIARPGYSAAEIIKALHDGSRIVKFRYDLLDAKNQFKRELKTVENGEIAFDSEAEIMRTGQFTILDDRTIDYLSNRIKPHMCLKMPGGWVDWPLGVFLLASPQKDVRGLTVYREVEAYDTTLALKQDCITERLFIAAGTTYTAAWSKVFIGAGVYDFNIKQSAETLASDREWAPGTPRLDIINALLAEINYTPLYADENGVYTATEKKDPTIDDAEYIYTTKEDSIIGDGASEEIDYFELPNYFIGYTSSPDAPALKSVYVNNSPLSVLSVANRGRPITEKKEFENIASQTALDRAVYLWAQERSNVDGIVSFPSALMPFHGYRNVLGVEHETLRVADIYTEMRWSMPLLAGEQMRHSVKKVISL